MIVKGSGIVVFLWTLLVLTSCMRRATSTHSHTLRGSTSSRASSSSSFHNALACTLAAADASACASNKDDDGTACVWCTFASSGGVCLDQAQADELSAIVPQVECGSRSGSGGVEFEDTDDESVNDVDVAVDSVIHSPQSDDEEEQNNLWKCLMMAQQEYCTCTWCAIKGDDEAFSAVADANFGLCLPDDAAEALEEKGLFECNPASSATAVDNTAPTRDESSFPIDVTCLAAGMNSNDAQSVCDATLDATGKACVWCDMTPDQSGYGLCLSDDVAQEAAKYHLTCDTSNSGGADESNDKSDEKEKGTTATSNNVDDLVLLHSTNTDKKDEDLVQCLKHLEEEDCNMSTDECTWCQTLAGFGVCLDPKAVEVAKMYQPMFRCDDNDAIDKDASVKENAGMDDKASVSSTSTNDAQELQDNEEAMSPTDPTCVAAGFQGDEDTCHATIDQDGNTCVWCSAGGAGLCLTTDQAAMASQWLTCDDNGEEASSAVDEQIESPTDPTCVEAGLQADEDICHATIDQDGNACVWCTAGGARLCLTTDQASMASQWLTCDDDNEDEPMTVEANKIESPTDPTCVEAGLQADEDICHATVDQDGNACVWCTAGGAGLCLTSDQASMASQWLTCDDDNEDEPVTVEANKIESPTDPTCVEAGLQADEDICHATVDQDGNACVWCTAGGAGLCLTTDQASMASQWLTCDDENEEETLSDVDEKIESPTDPTCVEAGLQADEDICHVTVDQDGNACVWCTAGGAGLCLTTDQASMASQWLTCDGEDHGTVEMS